MAARLDGLPRSDKGKYRKYATAEEKAAARKEQRQAAMARYREKHKEKLREKSKDYRTQNAKACIERTTRWQAANSDRVKDNVYRRKYGITLQEYTAMVDARAGRCDVCKRERPLVVDHCHSTGVVRGLLCDRCNVGVGCFGESLATLEAAIRYLKANGDPNYIDNWHDIIGYAKLVENRLLGAQPVEQK